MKDSIRKVLGYPIDTPLKFWLKYWEYHLKELCDLDCFDTQLDSPHFLLNEIISEIEYNNFRNSDNRRLFRELLGAACKQDRVFSKLYKTEVGYALKNWDQSPLVVKTVCNDILRSIAKYDYLNAIAQQLQNILGAEAEKELTENNKSEICLYTDLFIQEFICLGVDVNDIARFIEEDELLIRDDGKVILCRDSFYELKRNNYKSDEEYYCAVEKRCKTLCAKEYIDNILNHFYKKTQIGYVIFRLLGVKGSIDYHFQDIHLYSTDKVTYLPKICISKIENDDNSFRFVNVAVKVEHRFFNTSLNYARQKVNILLDYLSFNIKPEEELAISRQYAAIVVDGHECGSYNSIEDNLEYRHTNRNLLSYDLTPIRDNLNGWLEEFTGNSDINNRTFQRISNSTHWYKKAVCAGKSEDKLLYSWIALESILKASDAVRENILPKDNSILNMAKTICTSLMVRNRFYSYAQRMYIHLIKCTQNYDNYYDFKSETIERAKLNLVSGEKIDLSNFFKELPVLISEMNDEVDKRELIKMGVFYEDENGIRAFKNAICNDITLIYRLRNMIVHNAVCPEFQIKLYAYKAQFICGSLIQAIRFHYNKSGLDIDNALLDIYTQCQLFENNISTHIKRLKGLCLD